MEGERGRRATPRHGHRDRAIQRILAAPPSTAWIAVVEPDGAPSQVQIPSLLAQPAEGLVRGEAAPEHSRGSAPDGRDLVIADATIEVEDSHALPRDLDSELRCGHADTHLISLHHHVAGGRQIRVVDERPADRLVVGAPREAHHVVCKHNDLEGRSLEGDGRPDEVPIELELAASEELPRGDRSGRRRLDRSISAFETGHADRIGGNGAHRRWRQRCVLTNDQLDLEQEPANGSGETGHVREYPSHG